MILQKIKIPIIICLYIIQKWLYKLKYKFKLYIIKLNLKNIIKTKIYIFNYIINRNN